MNNAKRKLKLDLQSGLRIMRTRSAASRAEGHKKKLDFLWQVYKIRPSQVGAVAQLGERYNGIVEVTGSIPVGSTKYNMRPVRLEA